MEQVAVSGLSPAGFASATRLRRSGRPDEALGGADLRAAHAEISLDAEVEDLHHVRLTAGHRDESVLARRQRLFGPQSVGATRAGLREQLDRILWVHAVTELNSAPAPAIVLAHRQIAIPLA